MDLVISGKQNIVASGSAGMGKAVFRSILSRSLCGVLVLLALAPRQALATHWVSVVRPEPVSKTVHLTVLAQVLDTAGNDNSIPRPGRSYHLSIQLPEGVTPDLYPGSIVSVALPTIHHSNALARVASVSKARIELILADQVQLLEGQQLRASLPLRPTHLFRIPFQAVYSPRGMSTEVFLITSEKQARLIPVVPLQVLPDGKIIVSSDQLGGADIIAQGTDNLITGDSVQVVDQKGASHL